MLPVSGEKYSYLFICKIYTWCTKHQIRWINEDLSCYSCSTTYWCPTYHYDKIHFMSYLLHLNLQGEIWGVFQTWLARGFSEYWQQNTTSVAKFWYFYLCMSVQLSDFTISMTTSLVLEVNLTYFNYVLDICIPKKG